MKWSAHTCPGIITEDIFRHKIIVKGNGVLFTHAYIYEMCVKLRALRLHVRGDRVAGARGKKVKEKQLTGKLKQ